MIDLSNYVNSGLKNYSGGNDYTLLIDSKGDCLISQSLDGGETIKYCKMTQPTGTAIVVGTDTEYENPTIAQIVASITAFWTGDITTYNYVFVFQL